MGQVYTSPTSISAGGLFVNVSLNDPRNVAVLVFMVFVGAFFALSEHFNLHMPYSKFAREDTLGEVKLQWFQKLFRARMPSRPGFFLLYFVPFVSYLVMWIAFAVQNTRVIGAIAPSPGYSIVLLVMWLSSFFKRCVEVLFVHVYSGDIPVVSSVAIALGYSTMGVLSLFYANQVVGYTAFGTDTVVKDSIAVALYVIGFLGNFYGHYQLRVSRLKKAADGSKRYLAPYEIGILFKWFICPHYLFEIVLFAGFALFGATTIHYIIGFGVMGYLSGRTISTYKWYASKGLLTGSSSESLKAVSPSSL